MSDNNTAINIDEIQEQFKKIITLFYQEQDMDFPALSRFELGVIKLQEKQKLTPDLLPYWNSIAPFLLVLNDPVEVLVRDFPAGVIVFKNLALSSLAPELTTESNYRETFDKVEQLSLINFVIDDSCKSKQNKTKSESIAYKLAFESLFNRRIQNIFIITAIKDSPGKIIKLTSEEININARSYGEL